MVFPGTMRFLSCCSLIATALIGTPGVGSAAETVSRVVTVEATFSSRTSLHVSADLLEFDVASPGRPATAAIEFSAGARTRPDAEVVLSVEPLRGMDGPGGAADVESPVSFAGEGGGTMSGTLASSGAAVAGRWIGSGLRRGRLVFALRSGAAGTYTLPVRFVLSAP